MGRLRWPERVTDQAGNGIVQASCTFTRRDAGTPVVVYPDRLGSIASSQPLLADRNGEVVAYVDEADLPVRVTAALDGWSDTFDWEFPGQAIPTGGAGGVLSGQYPNPGFANDMAFQSELDAVQAQLQASIATIPTSATGAAGGDLSGTYPNPTIGAGKVTAVKLAADAVDSSKVQDGSLALGDLSAAGVRDATKFLRGDNNWAVPPGKAIDALSADIPEKVAWESPAGTDVVELYGVLTPAAAFVVKATDDFSSDTIAAGSWTNFGGVGLAISGGKLTAGGAGQTRTLRWTLQGASAVVRKMRVKFTISSGLPTNFNSTMPTNVWLGASDFIRPETNFISTTDVRLSIVKVDGGVRTNLADGTSKTQAAWSVAGTWTGEAERNGDLLTARLWAPGLNPDVDTPTGIVSVTLAGANKTKFGAGVSSYPALMVEDSPPGGWDDATLYEQQLEQRDLYAAITPAGGARVVRRLLGFSGAALERSDLPLDLAVTTAKLADGAVTSAKILDGTIVDADVAAANKDGTAATPSLRTLGTGAQQAAAGTDARLSDQRTPLDNSVTAAKVVDGSLGLGELSATGVRDATTFLRGDNSFAVPAGGGGSGLAKVTSFPGSPADGDVVVRTDLTGSPLFAYSTENGWEQSPRMGAVTVPSVRATRLVGGAQAIANAATATVLLPTEDYDTDALHDLVTNTSRLTVRTPGLYAVTGYVQLAANATGIVVVDIVVNGVAVDPNPTAKIVSGVDVASIARRVRLAVGDYVELRVQNTSGASVTIGRAVLETTWYGGPGQTVDERGVPACRATVAGGSQSVVTTGSPILLLPTEDFDTDGMHDPSVNNSRVTIKTPGLYSIEGFAECNTSPSGNPPGLNIYKNGALLGPDPYFLGTSGATGRARVSGHALLAAGDYLELQYTNGSTGTLVVGRASLSVVWQGVGRPVTPFARVGKSASQTIASAAAETRIAFDTEAADNDTIHDTVTNNSRLTCKTAGVYQITLNMLWGTSATGTRIVYLTKNNPAGVIVTANHLCRDSRPSGLYGYGQTLTTLAELAVGDYVEAWMYHEAGTAIGADPGAALSMVKMGG